MPTLPITATYRLQLNQELTLDQAAERLPYLVALGVSHAYLSPVLASVPGSTHGYDVVDHGSVAEQLGGERAFDRFTETARELGIGVVLDIVPNHVSIGGHNLRWLDVLEHGPSSSSACWFDIDWVGREQHHRGVVVLPVLDDLYGAVLDSGEIAVGRSGARFHVDCPGHRFPLAPRSLRLLLHPAAGRLRSEAARDTEQVRQVETLSFVVDWLDGLQPATTASERRRRSEHLHVLHRLLLALVEERAVSAALDAEVEAVNADPAAVHRVLEEQHYRLSYWRTAVQELDYRRFFDVSDLAAIRAERDEVFRAVHELPLRWIGEGRVDGLRVDHPDGLADPHRYFSRLRSAAPHAWIVAEKILRPGERLPPTWPVDGTTGYDALRLVSGLLVDPAGLDAAAEVERSAQQRYGAEPPDPVAVIRNAKHLAVEGLLAADLDRVVDHVVRIAERLPLHRDHPRADLRRAVAALAVGLDVYRTYVSPADFGGSGARSDQDAQRIDAAARRALDDDPSLDPRLVRFLADLATLRAVDPAAGPTEDERQFVIRFQQLTGPATAKGLEDTAWYRLPRFVAACEVGGDPLHPSVSLDELHDQCRLRQRDWPRTMTALSTHDTKRSGDVRARLAVLSEPGLAVPWPALAGRWLPRLAERWPHAVAPHAPTLLLALQTMVGAWPIDAGRLGDYLRKAGREAKERTSWTSPDEAFEGALEAVAGVVEEPGFAAAFDAETAEIRRLGASNTLVQAAVGLLAPGVPDVYQGNESVDLSLVDPDNRRPVDFDRLKFALDHDDRRPPPSPAGRLDGDATDHKLRLTAACLRLRRRRPESFGPGSAGAHRRLDVAGADGDRVVAFARGSGAALVAVRFPARGPVDPGTTVLLPGHPWQPVFGGCATGGGLVPVAALCPDLPVAVLEAAR